jgi:hypothetical protein
MASIVSAGVSSPLGVGAVFTVPGHKAPAITSDLIAAMRMPSTPGERFSIDLSPVLPVSVQGRFYFSALADPSGGNLRYSCISTAGDASRLRTIYGCLADIQASVQASADPNDHAAVRRTVEKWNAPGSDQLVRVQAGLEDIKATMKDAMDKVLERGERMEGILAQSEDIMEAASAFRQGAIAVEKKQWWQMWKWRLLSVLAALIVIGIPVAFYLIGQDDGSAPAPAPPSGGQGGRG